MKWKRRNDSERELNWPLFRIKVSRFLQVSSDIGLRPTKLDLGLHPEWGASASSYGDP